MIAKTVKIFLNSAFLLLIALGLLVVFSFLPFPGNYKVFTVLSGSMEPTIKTGALIFTKPQESYAIGDIITRKTLDPAVTITHRIVEQQELEGNPVFITKGDANNGNDGEFVSPESVVGKVIFDVPYLGYPVGYAKTQQGFILLVIIPAVIIVYEELSKIKYEIQKKMRFKKASRDPYAKNLNVFYRKKEDTDDSIFIKEK